MQRFIFCRVLDIRVPKIMEIIAKETNGKSYNTEKNVDLSQFSADVQNVLRFYLITRDMAKDMVID